MAGSPLQITIDLHEVTDFIQKFPIEGPIIVGQELRGAMTDSLGYIEQRAVDLANSFANTAAFENSIYSETLGVVADVRGVEINGVVSSSDYEPKVRAIEYGRLPGGKLPPVAAIALWVKRKGLAGTYSIKTSGKNQTHRRKGTRAKQDAQDLSLAWAIAISIARKGTKAKHVFQQAYDQSIGYVEKTFDAAIDYILNAWSKI